MTVEYATYQGQRVQVLDRFTDRVQCRVCANAPMDQDGPCPACGGEGYERERVALAKIGLLEGDKAGTTQVVRAGALTEAPAG